ncbi:multicopper oxidase family protein [Isoptericola croceus]|uniref:multicopper oxidase family protein n=1 Tax=Isoptericola croceus TaxID=3031406 RepID=UPI0023F9E0B1|nr:multicopper oxidase domain-containing protein [Isoptericola croceus]
MTTEQPSAAARARTRSRRRVITIVTLCVALVAVLLGAAGAVVYARAALDTAGQVAFDRELAIPPLADSSVQADGTRVFTLKMLEGATDLGQGTPTPTLGVNGSFLGPTLRAERGEQVRIDVTNSMAETSTLHWHGMKLPAAMDGGPHQVVAPGEKWSPTWTIDQPASTLWYHPHLHGRTADHAYRGLAGFFLVDEPGTVDLPDDYGVDDVPLVIQDKSFDADGSLDDGPPLFSPVGIVGDTILVNGTPGPYLDVTTERVRLRVLNGANARVMNLGFTDDRAFAVIASDGGLLPEPVRTDRLTLSPGDRAEIVVDVAAGERTVLRSHPQDLGTNPVTARFSGGDDTLDVLELRAAESLAPTAQVPGTLAGDDARLPDAGTATATRTFTLAGNSINGEPMDMGRIDEVVESGATEIWEVLGRDDMVHNFHVHDAQFHVLDVAGTVPPLELQGWQDTVYLQPGKVTRLLVTFGNHTDSNTPYMYHCHILAHEDAGMMGQFVVVGPGEEAPDRIEVLDDGTHLGHGAGYDAGHEQGDGRGPRTVHLGH